MNGLRSDFIEVYVFRRRGRRIQFLCLRRGRVSYLPGVWQPVTGRRRRGETSRAAAAREVLEETGLAPARWWALEAPTVYYDFRHDRVMALPLFAAEVAPQADVRLSREHGDWAFLGAREAGRRFLWEAQRRGLADVRRQVLAGGPLARTLEIAVRARRPHSRRIAKAGVRRRRPA